MEEWSPDKGKIPDTRKESRKLEEYQRLEQRMEGGLASREEAEFSAELAAGAPLTGSPVAMRKELGRQSGFSTPSPETYGAERVQVRDAEQQESRSRTADLLGWSAFVLALLSLFALPGILGAAAIVLGLISVYKGSRSLGAWSVLIGIVTTVTNLILIPLLG
ncbi:hypothetical protein [Gorillibacterium timonense]|uniref:hypothetical protein n=1 Tax=Gorillibacterium timonense TaxID=1689269 RepID=UPI00071D1C1F|nr:hypothetical protein [Gorillibacterium timonense]